MTTLRTLALRVTVTRDGADYRAAIMEPHEPLPMVPRYAYGETAAEALATLRDRLWQAGIRPVWTDQPGVSPADREVPNRTPAVQADLFSP